MKRLAVFLIVCTSLVAGDNFTQQIHVAKAQISSGNYNLAAITLVTLRRQVADTRSRPMDFQDLKTRNLEKTATLESVLAELTEAQSRYEEKDVSEAVRLLDVAEASLVFLYRKIPADELLARQRVIVNSEVAQARNGEASLSSLLEGARIAYRASDYDTVVQFAHRAVHAAMPIMGQGMNFAHTLAGLAYWQSGDMENAKAELAASIQVPASPAPFLPSMALAKALLAKQPQAVLTFLDAAARRSDWREKDSARQWKAEIESGRIPDFRPLTTLGL